MWKCETEEEVVQDAQRVTNHCLSYTIVKREFTSLLSGNETNRRSGGCAGTDTAVPKGVATAAAAAATTTTAAGATY